MSMKVGHYPKVSFFHDVVASNLLQGRQNVADCRLSEADTYRSWTGHHDVTELAASSPHMGHLAASQSVLRHWFADRLRSIPCRNCADPLQRPVLIWCTSIAVALSILAKRLKTEI